MRADHTHFKIGIAMIIVMFCISVTLQLIYRAQKRSLSRTNSTIVHTQQEIAQAQAQLSGLIRPEVLRNIISGMYPNFESIGFKKYKCY